MRPTTGPAGPAHAAAAMSEAESALLRDVIYRASGILLGEDKAPFLVARLSRRLHTHRLRSWSEYYRLVMGGHDRQELVALLDAITTNETQFFREARQFDFLEGTVFPEWRSAAREGRRPRRVRAWSAACATGEEAYSLAMCMLAHLPRAEGWSVEVLGTDLSTRALAVAREATWSIEGAASIPAEHRRRFMLQGTGSQRGRMRAGDELRSVIRFERANLSDERYEHSGPFDLILCRNVLIYFGELARSATLRRIAGHLGPGGYLLLGHAESPGRALADLDLVQATVYRAPTNRPRATP